MENITLNAEKRDIIGRQVKKLRQADKLPAVIYGRGFENQNLTLNYLEFEKAFKQAGESTLIDLQLEDLKPVKILIQDIARDPVTDKIIHADLRQVKMTEKLEAEISLKLVGTSPAVKELGGVLVTALDSLHIKALPQDLVHEIEVDISGLKEFNDMIYVRDLNIPEELEVLTKFDTTVVLVEAPRVEEIEEKPEEEENEAIKAREGEEKEGEPTKEDKKDKDGESSDKAEGGKKGEDRKKE